MAEKAPAAAALTEEETAAAAAAATASSSANSSRIGDLPIANSAEMQEALKKLVMREQQQLAQRTPPQEKAFNFWKTQPVRQFTTDGQNGEGSEGQGAIRTPSSAHVASTATLVYANAFLRSVELNKWYYCFA